MASLQPRHGELRLHRSNKHQQKIRWALNTCHSGFYMLGDTLDLLSLAAQRAVMLSDNEAAQLVKTTSDEPQDSDDSDSDEYHPSLTVSTPLASDELPPSTVGVSQPQRESVGALKRCVSKFRVLLLVLILLSSP